MEADDIGDSLHRTKDKFAHVPGVDQQEVEKRSRLHIFSVFVGEQAGVVKILMLFSELCVPLFGF